MRIFILENENNTPFSRVGMGFHCPEQRSLKKGARASSPFLNGFQPFSGSWLSNRVTTLASHRASIPAGRILHK